MNFLNFNNSKTSNRIKSSVEVKYNNKNNRHIKIIKNNDIVKNGKTTQNSLNY